MTLTIKAAGVVLALGMLPAAMPLASETAKAQSAPAAATSRVSSQALAQSRPRRPRVRIFRQDDRGVYPSYDPGPNAVRDCSATYVQEFRPSGTVIVPRVNCFWRPG